MAKHFPKYIKEIEKHDKYAKYNKVYEIPGLNSNSGLNLKEAINLEDIIDFLVDSNFGYYERIGQKNLTTHDSYSGKRYTGVIHKNRK